MKPVPYSEVDDWHDVIIHTPVVDVKGKFTVLRVDHDTLPKGLHAYDIRHGDESDWTDMASIEYHVLVNHCGTLVTGRDLKLPEWGYQITDYEYL